MFVFFKFRAGGGLLGVIVVTYMLWCEHNNGKALCGGEDMLVAPMGYMKGAYRYFVVCLTPKCSLLIAGVTVVPSLADSVSGTHLKLAANKLC